MHLLVLHKLMAELKPRTVIVDPISSLVTIGSMSEVRAMLVRLMDILKMNGINALFTCLMHHNANGINDDTIDAVSSLADNWLYLKNDRVADQRTRSLLIVKSRGMGHHNDHIDFNITNKGIVLQAAKA
jgi:circadian clock protein KaiC